MRCSCRPRPPARGCPLTPYAAHNHDDATAPAPALAAAPRLDLLLVVVPVRATTLPPATRPAQRRLRALPGARADAPRRRRRTSLTPRRARPTRRLQGRGPSSPGTGTRRGPSADSDCRRSRGSALGPRWMRWSERGCSECSATGIERGSPRSRWRTPTRRCRELCEAGTNLAALDPATDAGGLLLRTGTRCHDGRSSRGSARAVPSTPVVKGSETGVDCERAPSDPSHRPRSDDGTCIH